MQGFSKRVISFFDFGGRCVAGDSKSFVEVLAAGSAVVAVEGRGCVEGSSLRRGGGGRLSGGGRRCGKNCRRRGSSSRRGGSLRDGGRGGKDWRTTRSCG